MDSWQSFFYGVLAGSAVILAVRINFQFDLNKWQESRKKSQTMRLQNMCPHVRLGKSNNEYYFESLFISPSGTINWFCEQCNRVAYGGVGGENPGSEDLEYWKNHIPELIKKDKAFRRQAKKMGLVP